MTSILFQITTSVRKPPYGSALDALALRFSPRKGLVIPFGLRLAQAQQERSAPATSTLTDH